MSTGDTCINDVINVVSGACVEEHSGTHLMFSMITVFIEHIEVRIGVHVLESIMSNVIVKIDNVI